GEMEIIPEGKIVHARTDKNLRPLQPEGRPRRAERADLPDPPRRRLCGGTTGLPRLAQARHREGSRAGGADRWLESLAREIARLAPRLAQAQPAAARLQGGGGAPRRAGREGPALRSR